MAYLLTADTFLDGRLTAPVHPHWEHFEQINVLSRPTFASKHPPGQGAVLAFGRLLFGHPAAGVWISAGVLVFAVGWMLLAWLPPRRAPRWAVLGAALVALRFGAGHVWSESYWGGYLAAIGGALTFGALGRLVGRWQGTPPRESQKKEQQARLPGLAHGLVLGGGLAILVFTRPFEGFLAALPAAALLAWTLLGVLRRDGGKGVRSAAPAVLGTVAVLFPSLFGLAYYHQAVTGDPLVFPHRLYEREYSLLPQFVFDEPPPAPEFRHRDLEGVARRLYHEYHEPGRLWVGPAEALRRLAKLVWGALGAAWLALFVWRARWLLRRPRAVFAGATVLFVVLGHSVAQSYMFHYSAPVLPLLLFLGTAALRGQWSGPVRSPPDLRRRAGTVAVLLVVAFELGSFAVRLAQPPRTMDWYESKREIARELEKRPGRDLVFVRYGPYHLPHWDWISNTGDLASQEIVWARTMSPEEDRSLREHFSDRRAWTVDVGYDLWDPWTPPPVELRPWEPASADSEMDSSSVPLTDESRPSQARSP